MSTTRMVVRPLRRSPSAMIGSSRTQLSIAAFLVAALAGCTGSSSSAGATPNPECAGIASCAENQIWVAFDPNAEGTTVRVSASGSCHATKTECTIPPALACSVEVDSGGTCVVTIQDSAGGTQTFSVMTDCGPCCGCVSGAVLDAGAE